MRSLTSFVRCLSSATNPTPSIRVMAPQFQFVKTPPPFDMPSALTTWPLINEVLRCHSYFDDTVFANVLSILNTVPQGQRAEATKLAKARYIAVVFHAIRDRSKREQLSRMAAAVEWCKVPVMRKEQEQFLNSLSPSTGEIPDFKRCLHKNDLTLCYFRRELEAGNWENVVKLLEFHYSDINLYDHIDRFVEVGRQNNRPDTEISRVFMKYSRNTNGYFVELTDFEKIVRKFAKLCSLEISECKFDKGFVSKSGKELRLRKSHISNKELELLKKKIDEHVKKSKEGLVKTGEYNQIRKTVANWLKEGRIRKDRRVVVVDALNFGYGADPKEWKRISNQFDQVVFATRLPPREVRDKVMKRYGGNVIFCDKVSADDLLILRMALEFGAGTSIVTNDMYRDHRDAVCGGDKAVRKIWDDFMIDAGYRHKDGCIESRRDFNLRIRNVDDTWFVPVLDPEGISDLLRNIKVYSIEKKT